MTGSEPLDGDFFVQRFSGTSDVGRDVSQSGWFSFSSLSGGLVSSSSSSSSSSSVPFILLLLLLVLGGDKNWDYLLKMSKFLFKTSPKFLVKK